jgi:hypothetical protein
MQVREIERLQRIIALCARTIYNADRRTSSLPLIKKLKWLPVKERSIYRSLCLIHKIMYGAAPQYLKEELAWYKPRRNLRSNNAYLLQKQMPAKRVGEMMWTAFGPMLWNKLPQEIRCEDKRNKFESRTFNNLLDTL